MNTGPLSALMIVGGIVLVTIGLILYFGGGWVFSYLGRLPGDLRFEHGNFRIYVPITTTVILSIILTAVLYVIARVR